MKNKLANVTVSIITRNRQTELLETLLNIDKQDYSNIEIVLVDNGSDNEIILSVENYLETLHCNVEYIQKGENLGVSGGRNVGLQAADGDYIIEIDDDAVFEDEQAISKAVSFMDDNPSIGISAFRITNYHTKEIVPQEFPFRDKNRDPFISGETTWFIGAGHIIRKELIEKIGHYHEFFPWGSEEQDYSIRAIDAGFKIFYLADINVFHKKSPNARISDKVEFASIALKNRMKVALLNLPLSSIFTYAIIRGFQFLVKFKNPVIILKAIKHIFNEFEYIRKNRTVVSKKTLDYLSIKKGQRYF